MKSEEAIKVLKDCTIYHGSDVTKEALDMAIKALENADKYHWHDLRKDPKDLPIYNQSYLVSFITDGLCKYSVLPRSAIIDLIEIIEAWKETEPFEEEANEQAIQSIY